MAKILIKFGLINLACIIDLVAILLTTNHWFTLKPIIIRTIIYTLIGIGVLSTIVLSLSLNSIMYEKTVTVLGKTSLIVFGICVLATVIKILHLDLERGSTLYQTYSLPALLPVISGLIVSILKK